jgi:predicted TPR repeat methyltransferase
MPTASPTPNQPEEETTFGIEVYSTSVTFKPGTDKTVDPKELERLLKAIEETPQNPDPWLALGRHYWSTGDKEQAIQCFDQVLRLKPDFHALQVWLSRYKTLTPTDLKE